MMLGVLKRITLHPFLIAYSTIFDKDETHLFCFVLAWTKALLRLFSRIVVVFVEVFLVF